MMVDDCSTQTPVSDRLSDSGDWNTPLQENWDRVNMLSPLNPWKLYLRFRRAKIVTVEPVLFLYMFGTYMLFSMIEQYYLKRFGLEKLHNTSFPFPNGSESFCINSSQLDKYGGNGTSDDVQASASHLLLYGQVPNQLLSIVTALMFGPLSDRFGRRPLMVVIGIGVTLNGLMTLGIVHYNLSVYLFVVTNVITGFTGGFASVLTLCFAYIADVSSLKWRTLRIGIVEAMIFGGGALGEGISGLWLNELNCFFEPIFWLYTAVNTLIIVYVLVFLPEPLTRRERLENAKNRPRGYKAVLQGFGIFFCSPWQIRLLLWFALIAMSIIVMNMIGSQEITIFFLSATHPLEWKPKTIGLYQATTQASHMIGLLVILPILVALKLPDALIGLIGLVFNCGMNIFTGFVRQSWQMFVIGIVSGVEAVISPVLRGIMSKLISFEDQGALFSFVASTELLSSAIATTLYGNVYPETLKQGLSSGTAYLLMAILCVIPAPLILLLLILRNWRSRNPEELSSRVRDSKPPEPTEQDSLLPESSPSPTYGTESNYTGKIN